MSEEAVWSEQNSNTFLSYYNEIDKLFTKLLGVEKYIPFNERIAAIAAWTFPISAYVKHCDDKLRYFGDLRNQLVHGFRLDHRHYLLVGDHAIHEISHICKELKNPTSLVETFGQEIVSCFEDESLKMVLLRMKETQKSHIPVYSGSPTVALAEALIRGDEQPTFLGMLSESTIAYWLADVMDAEGDVHADDVLVKDIPLENTNDMYVFVPETMNIYELDALFAKEREHLKRLGAVCVTKSWSQDEQICCVITALDLPKVNAYMMVSF